MLPPLLDLACLTEVVRGICLGGAVHLFGDAACSWIVKMAAAGQGFESPRPARAKSPPSKPARL
jgi:hypothetical protein